MSKEREEKLKALQLTVDRLEKNIRERFHHEIGR